MEESNSSLYKAHGVPGMPDFKALGKSAWQGRSRYIKSGARFIKNGSGNGGVKSGTSVGDRLAIKKSNGTNSMQQSRCMKAGKHEIRATRKSKAKFKSQEGPLSHSNRERYLGASLNERVRKTQNVQGRTGSRQGNDDVLNQVVEGLINDILYRSDNEPAKYFRPLANVMAGYLGKIMSGWSQEDVIKALTKENMNIIYSDTKNLACDYVCQCLQEIASDKSGEFAELRSRLAFFGLSIETIANEISKIVENELHATFSQQEIDDLASQIKRGEISNAAMAASSIASMCALRFHDELFFWLFRENLGGQLSTPQPVLPQPVLPQPVLPQPVLPQPVLPQPVPPQPVLPQPVLPQPVLPQPVPPQPVLPQPVPPQPVPPQPVLPQPVLPQPVPPKPVLPQPVLPQPVLPQPVPPKPVLPQPVLPKPVLPQPVPPQPVPPKPVPPKPVPQNTTYTTTINITNERIIKDKYVTVNMIKNNSDEKKPKKNDDDIQKPNRKTLKQKPNRKTLKQKGLSVGVGASAAGAFVSGVAAGYSTATCVAAGNAITGMTAAAGGLCTIGPVGWTVIGVACMAGAIGCACGMIKGND